MLRPVARRPEISPDFRLLLRLRRDMRVHELPTLTVLTTLRRPRSKWEKRAERDDTLVSPNKEPSFQCATQPQSPVQ